MLIHALQQIGSGAGIEPSITFACHDVNGRLFHSTILWMGLLAMTRPFRHCERRSSRRAAIQSNVDSCLLRRQAAPRNDGRRLAMTPRNDKKGASLGAALSSPRSNPEPQCGF